MKPGSRVKPSIPVSSLVGAATSKKIRQIGPIAHVKQCDGYNHSKTTISSSLNELFVKVKHFTFYNATRIHPVPSYYCSVLSTYVIQCFMVLIYCVFQLFRTL